MHLQVPATELFGSLSTETWDEHIQVSSLIDRSASRVLGRLRDHVADWYLHLVRIGLSLDVIEIQIGQRLIDTIEILQISKRDQAPVAETISLIAAKP